MAPAARVSLPTYDPGLNLIKFCPANGLFLCSSGGPDSVKKAPFVNKSPSDRHCHFFHSSGVAMFIAFYLFGVLVIGGLESVALANDGRVRATSDCVELPMGVVVVDDMGESPPDTWHPLYAPYSEPVERDRHLHDRVLGVRVLEMVMAVDPSMMSISPSTPLESDTWSIHTRLDP
ncbi:tetratricopeptide repeat protein [Striga asiatica]|uniref:Tetratricopeptide repeat protein n=1 Tax=Striga asiatica TaxID=4170 RepID=A0A5A7RFJ4_STRAF|nr:tetratricopeptide repeat protein [Striga asiatica]